MEDETCCYICCEEGLLVRGVCHCRTAMHPACQLRWVNDTRDPVCRICKRHYTNIVPQSRRRFAPDRHGLSLLVTSGAVCTVSMMIVMVYLQQHMPNLQSPSWSAALMFGVLGALGLTGVALCLRVLVLIRCRLASVCFTQQVTWTVADPTSGTQIC